MPRVPAAARWRVSRVSVVDGRYRWLGGTAGVLRVAAVGAGSMVVVAALVPYSAGESWWGAGVLVAWCRRGIPRVQGEAEELSLVHGQTRAPLRINRPVLACS